MNVTFTRCDGRTYTTSALRDDGVLLQVASYDRASLLPHDLAHFVVERELNVQYGFWGCVAAGALYPSIKVVSGRQKHDAAARSKEVIREAGQRGTEAEALVSTLLNILHQGSDKDWPDRPMLSFHFYDASKPPQQQFSGREVRRVCQVLREVEKQWQALAIGESISLSWVCAKRRKRGT